jgi:5-methylcytosine-specific restriction endonuclease McrA
MPKAGDWKEIYKKHYSDPKSIKERGMRNAARREAEKKGLVKKGDGKEVDHKKPLSKGGTNAASNLRVVDRKTNRSFKRGTGKGTDRRPK